MPVIQPGSFSQEVNTPARANGCRITLTRNSPWPLTPGGLFNWRIFLRERGSQDLRLFTFGTEMGGDATGKDGTLNPPLVLTVTFASPLPGEPKRDRDRIRFEADVFAAFNTTVSLDWI